ncbi:MAG: M23 family peptidase, partial [Pseudomonadota bacterium]|nr:M23 family peptidase [Pseudomonadota bacterium]
MARRVALLLLWMMLAVPAAAGEPALSGRFEQGGLVLGSGAAGADLRLDGRRLRVDDRGYFIF